MIFALLSIACFVAAFLLDSIEALYVRAVGATQPARAATYSVLMYAISCVGFFSVLSYSWWLMVPEVVGLAAGSYLTIARMRKGANIT